MVPESEWTCTIWVRRRADILAAIFWCHNPWRRPFQFKVPHLQRPNPEGDPGCSATGGPESAEVSETSRSYQEKLPTMARC
jgi:hypothetical protein